MNTPFLFRNLPPTKQTQAKDELHIINENISLKTDLQLYKSLFTYPTYNSCLFNLILVKHNGVREWSDRVYATKEYLLQCEQTEEVKDLLKNIHPKFEKY